MVFWPIWLISVVVAVQPTFRTPQPKHILDRSVFGNSEPEEPSPAPISARDIPAPSPTPEKNREGASPRASPSPANTQEPILRLDGSWSSRKVGGIATPVARTACEASAISWLWNRKRLPSQIGFNLLQSIQPATDDKCPSTTRRSGKITSPRPPL